MTNYEKEIEKIADFLKDNPEELKAILRNYDWIVKGKTSQRDLPLPYWCYCCCGNNEVEMLKNIGEEP